MKRILSLPVIAVAAMAFLFSGCGSVNHTPYYTKSQINPDGLAGLVAPGHKVYIDWVDAQGGLKQDEYDDFVRLTKGFTNWDVAESKDKADFVLRLIQNKKFQISSPTCWITPEVLTTDGRLLWRGSLITGGANEFSGFRATDRCFKKMLRYMAEKEPAFAAGIKTDLL